MQLFIISGLSGAGKSTALNALEDLGYYCVDNLPVSLLPAFATEMCTENYHLDKAAVGIDSRNQAEDLSNFPGVLDELKNQCIDVKVVFIEANDEIILNRFNETRRRHPLTSVDVPLKEAIALEHQLLNNISITASLRIDTTHLNVHALRQLIREHTDTEPGQENRMSVMLESFGFRNGVPGDADFVFDMRCLPNPHWEESLRALSGLDKPVKDFLDSQALAEKMYTDLVGFVDTWLPEFEKANKSYMKIACGCTGGRHRSVYITSRLAEYFKAKQYPVLIRHRELA